MDYERQPIAVPIPSSPRFGIQAWGIVLIVLGGVFALAGLFVMMGISGEQMMRMSQNPRARFRLNPAMVITCLTLLFMAAGLIWVGISTWRARRWVRPVLIVGSALLAIYGIFSAVGTAMVIWQVAYAPQSTNWRVNFASLVTMLLLRLAAELAFLVILPWRMNAYFRKPRTQQILVSLDPRPRPSWADVTPIPVVAWAAICFVAGFYLLTAPFTPVRSSLSLAIPPQAGLVAHCCLGILMLWASTLSFRQQISGWYTSLAVLTVNLTFALAALYIGSTEARPMGRDPLNLDFPPLLLHAMLALLAVVYAFYVHSFFLLPRARVELQPLPLPTPEPSDADDPAAHI